MPQRQKSSIEQFAAPKISTSKSKCDLNTSDQQQSTLDAVLALVGSAMASKTKENKMCSRTYPKAGKKKKSRQIQERRSIVKASVISRTYQTAVAYISGPKL
ncbi:uncharacterized protein RCO7_14485 [Rhynchosporium graminicola]|uniref:Uncharacterized protein n=1 Tax=Rhynchosporium graminicola TaxID=2792576 RepID=A0A1E1KJT7_9HELO|nr:uncharacterized protein RCO7_14485 [Rhynchosporium commune]